MMEDTEDTSLVAMEYFMDRDTTYSPDFLTYSGSGSENISCSALPDGRVQIRPRRDW